MPTRIITKEKDAERRFEFSCRHCGGKNLSRCGRVEAITRFTSQLRPSPLPFSHAFPTGVTPFSHPK